MEWWINVIIAVCGYLMGMAFAGSFIGRRWMGTVDITLHKLFKRKVTMGKYLYWKHFCGIGNPPKPEKLIKPKKLGDLIMSKIF